MHFNLTVLYVEFSNILTMLVMTINVSDDYDVRMSFVDRQTGQLLPMSAQAAHNVACQYGTKAMYERGAFVHSSQSVVC